MPSFADKMSFSLPDFMNSPTKNKPLQLYSATSDELSTTRTIRASTIQNGAIPQLNMDRIKEHRRLSQPDTLEKGPETNGEPGASAAAAASASASAPASGAKLPTDFDELPIELVSLSDSFIDSLSAKVHPTPPTVDKLSALFQDFYAIAATHINTHISTLSLRQNRDVSPSPSMSSLSSTASKLRAKAVSMSNKERPKPAIERRDSEQQMLTREEIDDRKKFRKALEHKRVLMEEAMERRVCEGIYDRIWRHRSTHDEAQDEKLRSKTAALSVVGIGLTDLGIDLGQPDSLKAPAAAEKKEEEIRQWLAEARAELIAMNDERYPLGKLQHLKAAHKCIVDTLSHFHPSSSADEIMPMLIYTLITSRPEGIDIISNLCFIQRFRCEQKMDGEAAYCLTNLEAAIAFLETVDLASLRADEVLSGPPKSSSRPNTPLQFEKPKKMSMSTPASISTSRATSTVTSAATSPTFSKGPTASSSLRPSIQIQNRRLSDMFQPPAAFIAAGDAMSEAADKGLQSIGDSLGSSYKFLAGKLKERQDETSGPPIAPKTLDDARKLVSTPPPEDDGSASGGSSLHSPVLPPPRARERSDSSTRFDDKVLSFVGGSRKIPRDRSTDSTRSGSTAASAKKAVAFAGTQGGEKSPVNNLPAATNPLESMRNLGNTLNPIGRLTGMGMMGRFGRASPAPMDQTNTSPTLASSSSTREMPKIAPPIKRFMEANPADLKISEVMELMRDYRRLAGALKDLGAV